MLLLRASFVAFVKAKKHFIIVPKSGIYDICILHILLVDECQYLCKIVPVQLNTDSKNLTFKMHQMMTISIG